MKAARRRQAGRRVRVSVSFDPQDYGDLQVIARKKKVSVAWVVREAVGTYLSAQAPLFRGSGNVEKNV